MDYTQQAKKGFTIIEIIITLAVLSFGIIGVYSAFLPFIFITNTMSSRLTAAYLAQEGVEIIRNIRDNNLIQEISWSDGLLACDAGCQADYKTGTRSEGAANRLQVFDKTAYLSLNEDGFYSYDTKDPASIFQRKITITLGQIADELKVDVQVTWNYNGEPHSFKTTEFLYNWY